MRMAVRFHFTSMDMTTSARTALVAILLAGPVLAEADPQSERTIAMDEVRMASQAEVLALGCGLRLNTRLRDMLRDDATIKLSPRGAVRHGAVRAHLYAEPSPPASPRHVRSRTQRVRSRGQSNAGAAFALDWPRLRRKALLAGADADLLRFSKALNDAE